MKVAQILKYKGSRVVRADPQTSVADAARALARERIGAMVVIDADQTLRGILSERDIVRGLAEHGAALLERPIAEVMTSDVITCGLERGLEAVMADMTDHRIRHLPVVEDGTLVGIVSIGDLVKYQLDELKTERKALRDYISTV